jgi:hypothetical protein
VAADKTEENLLETTAIWLTQYIQVHRPGLADGIFSNIKKQFLIICIALHFCCYLLYVNCHRNTCIGEKLYY